VAAEDKGFLEGPLQEVADPIAPFAEPSLWSSFLTVAGWLLLVLALFYLLSYFVRRWGLRQGWVTPQAGGLIRVLASQRLDMRRSVVLVEIQDRVMVLGLGAQEICLLQVFDNPKEVEALKKEGDRGMPSEGFQKSLATAFDRKDREDHMQAGRTAVSKARKILEDVMKKMNPGSKD